MTPHPAATVAGWVELCAKHVRWLLNSETVGVRFRLLWFVVVVVKGTARRTTDEYSMLLSGIIPSKLARIRYPLVPLC